VVDVQDLGGLGVEADQLGGVGGEGDGLGELDVAADSTDAAVELAGHSLISRVLGGRLDGDVGRVGAGEGQVGGD